MVQQQQRWVRSPPGSHWGEFGPDDQRGRMNLVTPAKVLQGIAEVKAGLTFCLSLPLDVPGGQAMNPRRLPPRRYAITRDGKSAGQQGFCWSYAVEDADLTDVVNDDLVLMSLQYSTQWDSLAHVGSRFDADGDGVDEAVFYNGFRAGQEIRAAAEDAAAAEPHARYPQPVAGALGIERLAELLAMNRQPDLARLHETGSGLDGWDDRLLNWIVDVRLACLIADNPAVELIVPKLTQRRPLRQPRLPLHEHCLFKSGIHLGELWYLTGLAAWLRTHGRSRFLLTAPPLRLPGAVGSSATPIATV